jgi:hypothetical protein
VGLEPPTSSLSGCRHHPLELGTGSATDPPSLRSCVGEVNGAQSQSNASVKPMSGGIVATQRMVLFYNAETRAGATALIDAGGVLGTPEAEGFPD